MYLLATRRFLTKCLHCKIRFRISKATADVVFVPCDPTKWTGHAVIRLTCPKCRRQEQVAMMSVSAHEDMIDEIKRVADEGRGVVH
jgi:hypothetical protein